MFKFIIFFEGGRKIDVVLSDMAPNLSGTLTYQLIFLVYFYYYYPPLSQWILFEIIIIIIKIDETRTNKSGLGRKELDQMMTTNLGE